MKTFYPSVSKALLALFTIVTFTISVKAQLNFTTHNLISGTDKQLGAKYRYNNVINGVNAVITIDSIIGGASVQQFDNTGFGFDAAFQPIIRPAANSVSYVVFRIQLFYPDNTTPYYLASATVEMADVDGTNNLKEFADVDMNGGLANYLSIIPQINLVSTPAKVRGLNVAGINVTGIDTSNKETMYKVVQSAVSDFKVRFGTVNTSNSVGVREFSFALYNNNQMGTSLPLTLLDFNVRLKNNDAQLNWTTTEHRDFSHFVVQRSTDGKNFKDLATVITNDVVSSSINQYGYTNNITGVNSTVVYYRLQMVDNDGTYEYSPIRLVRLNAINSVQIQAFPNPVVNELRIMIPTNWQEKTTTYEIYNSNGSLVSRTKVANATQVHQVNVQSLGSGNYIIRVTNGQETSSSKFVKY